MTKEKKILVFMTAVLVLMLAAFIFIPAPEKDEPARKIETNSKNIKVYNLVAGQEIKSPLVILGEAAGWYFEASFPVKITDGNGNILSAGPAQAKSDWMTTEFVPFEANLEFKSSPTETGFVILEADDPSGLNQDVEYIKIPIVFTNVEASQKMEIKAYFLNDELDPEITCSKVFPVSRNIPKTEAVARAALEELLKGPNQEDLTKNYTTAIQSQSVKIQKLEIKNSVAYADFSEELEKNSGGSCRVSAIRAQITETLKQFPTIKDVIISINGRSEDILQP